ncbi:MAG: acyl-CoA dehydrogenase family protein, partial [Chloroflexi bacterium]|nr:acyl-CoA dehydrogenase family protein [Chloroflexota bacterium]
MDFQLTEEHVMIKNMVREFAEKEIAPRAEEIDATDQFPADIFKRMGELGLLGIPFAEAYGGAGGDYISLLIALEEIARVSGTVAIILDAHTSLCCEPIHRYGTEAQKKKYLPKMHEAVWGGTMAQTEPGAGTDVGNLKTKAIRQPDGTFRLQGTKQFITAADS